MTVPAVEGLLTQPYVSVSEFRASPTWLDSDDLIPGGVQGQQDPELFNVLLRASAWADGYVNQRLGAHSAYEQTRARMDRQGRIILHPSNVPVRSITGLAYGGDFQNMTQLTDLSQVWVEDARGIVVATTPLMTAWAGPLQFGGPATPGCELYVQYQYVAGYACTTLAATATAGDMSITVTDPTGLQPSSTVQWGTLPGSTARVWDRGLEEAITVGSGYTLGSTTVPLASALQNTHTVMPGPAGQIAVSEMPPEVRQAVICFGVALILKEDASEEEPFPGSTFGPSVRRSNRSHGAGGGMIEDACMWLDRYRRVR